MGLSVVGIGGSPLGVLIWTSSNIGFGTPLQVPIIILSVFSGLVLGWEGFFWIGAIRLVYVLHMQMVVNSLLQLTPGLPEGVDSSRNLWWIGPWQLGAWGRTGTGIITVIRMRPALGASGGRSTSAGM